MAARVAIKPLKIFIEKMEGLKESVSPELDSELDSIIEQSTVLLGEAGAFFDSWEAEDEISEPPAGDDLDDDDEDEDEEEDEFVDVT